MPTSVTAAYQLAVAWEDRQRGVGAAIAGQRVSTKGGTVFATSVVSGNPVAPPTAAHRSQPQNQRGHFKPPYKGAPRAYIRRALSQTVPRSPSSASPETRSP
jgi:hypothetical protein